MNVLIIGGAGYIGFELSKIFCDESTDSVTIYDNFSNGNVHARVDALALGAEVIEGDIADREKLLEVFATTRPQLVYNLAAIHYIPYCIEHPDEVFNTNFLGMQNVITAIKSLSVAPKLIFASSASVYGSRTSPCVESDPYNPNDIYGASKVAGELLVKHQLTDYAIMRFFNAVGELDPHPHLLPKVARKVLAGERLQLGTADAYRDFIYVKDIARAIYLAKGAAAGAVYNVGTGVPHTVKEVVDAMFDYVGRENNVEYETSDNLRANDASFLCADASRLRQDLGWSPTVDFHQAIATAVMAAASSEALVSS